MYNIAVHRPTDKDYFFHKNGKEALVWHQCVALAISDGTNMVKIVHRSEKYKKGEAVMICWDAKKALEDTSTKLSQRLLKLKWNPKGRHNEGS
eukprot:2283361-Ditylum_brightwellii.AAC.1